MSPYRNYCVETPVGSEIKEGRSAEKIQDGNPKHNPPLYNVDSRNIAEMV